MSFHHRSLPGPENSPTVRHLFGWIATSTPCAAVIAQLVVESIQRGVYLAHYELHAYVVMADHVRLLLLPKIGSESARPTGFCNELGQKESYDRWVRNKAEFSRIRAYIENNPVKAGLSLVQRKRREKSRRSTHECVRHGPLTGAGRPARLLRNQRYLRSRAGDRPTKAYA